MSSATRPCRRFSCRAVLRETRPFAVSFTREVIGSPKYEPIALLLFLRSIYQILREFQNHPCSPLDLALYSIGGSLHKRAEVNSSAFWPSEYFNRLCV